MSSNLGYMRPLLSIKPVAIICWGMILAALGSFFVAPNVARAELTFPPATPFCESQLANPYNHYVKDAQLEKGSTAFAYGGVGAPFVSLKDNILTLTITLLFKPDPTNNYTYIGLAAFNPSCTETAFGYAFDWHYMQEGVNTLAVNLVTAEVIINNKFSTILYANSGVQYYWLDVWDGKRPTQQASYSYLVDITNPQNPSGTPGDPGGKRPVLIIPGIAGSELYNGQDLIWANLSWMASDNNDQFLTENLGLDEYGNSIRTGIKTGNVITKLGYPPLGINIFNDLEDELKNAGYVADESYHYFAYDWRLDIDSNKDSLKHKIEIIKLQSGYAKIDIIAHSMGGLLVKDYINDYGKVSIDKLIFVGTPHLGAPKAAHVLMYGDRYSIPWLEEDRVQEIAVNSPAAYELLPPPKYFDQFTGYIRKDFFLFPKPPLNYGDTKDFLLSKGLNNIVFTQAENFFNKNLQDLNLSGIDTYNIAGCKNDTQAGYQYGLGNWFINSLRYTTGDGTVPLPSAEYINIPAEKKYFIKKGEHAELPSFTPARDLILSILNGDVTFDQNQVSNSTSFCNFKGKEMVWKSPVEVHIYDEQGNHTGPIENNGIEYGIHGVSYDVIGHEKFVFLPTDDGQTYRVEAKGLENGTFDLRLSQNENGSVGQSTIFNDVPVTNNTLVQFNVSDVTPDNLIHVDENGNGNFENFPADSILNPIESDDAIPPQTHVNLAGAAGQNGWYTSTTTLSLSATDENSGVLYTKYSLDNGQNFQEYIQPFDIGQEGTTTIQYYSVDRAGNDEPVQTQTAKIDKTPPDITVEFSRQKGDFVFTAQDNLDPNPLISCTTNTCLASDSAGNQSALAFKKTKILTWYNLELVSIVYNSQQAIVLPKNLLVVKYSVSKGNLIDFNQTELIRGQEILRIDYQRDKNQSVIWSLESGGLSKQVVSGTKILQIKIQQDNIKTDIKQ